MVSWDLVAIVGLRWLVWSRFLTMRYFYVLWALHCICISLLFLIVYVLFFSPLNLKVLFSFSILLFKVRHLDTRSCTGTILLQCWYMVWYEMTRYTKYWYGSRLCTSLVQVGMVLIGTMNLALVSILLELEILVNNLVILMHKHREKLNSIVSSS